MVCGGKDLKTFLESAGKNAMNTSQIAVTEFIEARGSWVEEFLLKHLHQAPFYSQNVQMFLLLRSYLSSADG